MCHLDEGLHEVLLRNVVPAAHHLLQHPGQHQPAVRVEVQAVQLAEVRQVLAHQVRKLLPLRISRLPLRRTPRRPLLASTRISLVMTRNLHTLQICISRCRSASRALYSAALRADPAHLHQKLSQYKIRRKQS